MKLIADFLHESSNVHDFKVLQSNCSPCFAFWSKTRRSLFSIFEDNFSLYHLYSLAKDHSRWAIQMTRKKLNLIKLERTILYSSMTRCISRQMPYLLYKQNNLFDHQIVCIFKGKNSQWKMRKFFGPEKFFHLNLSVFKIKSAYLCISLIYRHKNLFLR